MITPTHPSAPALRAAFAIGFHHKKTMIAEIIDRETGLLELIAALTLSGAMLLSLQANHEGAWHETEREQVKAAILRARAALAKANHMP